MSPRYSLKRTSSIALFLLYVQSWLFIVFFGGILAKVGIPYWERLRFASNAEFWKASDWKVSAILMVTLGVVLAFRFEAKIMGAELEERFLSGRLRPRAWWRRGLRYRRTQRDPVTLRVRD
jgi:hypothetical protein